MMSLFDWVLKADLICRQDTRVFRNPSKISDDASAKIVNCKKYCVIVFFFTSVGVVFFLMIFL